MYKYWLLVSNGVIETKEIVTLHIFVRYFYDQPRCLQKKTVLDYISHNPLAMATLPVRIENKVAICLCIPGATEDITEPGEEESKYTSVQTPPEKT